MISLIPTVLWLLFELLSLKNDGNIPSKSNMQKNFFLNMFFVGVLKFHDENSRIRIQIRINIRIQLVRLSGAWFRGSGFASLGPEISCCLLSRTATTTVSEARAGFPWCGQLPSPSFNASAPRSQAQESRPIQTGSKKCTYWDGILGHQFD